MTISTVTRSAADVVKRTTRAPVGAQYETTESPGFDVDQLIEYRTLIDQIPHFTVCYGFISYSKLIFHIATAMPATSYKPLVRGVFGHKFQVEFGRVLSPDDLLSVTVSRAVQKLDFSSITHCEVKNSDSVVERIGCEQVKDSHIIRRVFQGAKNITSKLFRGKTRANSRQVHEALKLKRGTQPASPKIPSMVFVRSTECTEVARSKNPVPTQGSRQRIDPVDRKMEGTDTQLTSTEIPDVSESPRSVLTEDRGHVQVYSAFEENLLINRLKCNPDTLEIVIDYLALKDETVIHTPIKVVRSMPAEFIALRLQFERIPVDESMLARVVKSALADADVLDRVVKARRSMLSEQNFKHWKV